MDNFIQLAWRRIRDLVTDHFLTAVVVMLVAATYLVWDYVNALIRLFTPSNVAIMEDFVTFRRTGMAERADIEQIKKLIENEEGLERSPNIEKSVASVFSKDAQVIHKGIVFFSTPTQDDFGNYTNIYQDNEYFIFRGLGQCSQTSSNDSEHAGSTNNASIPIACKYRLGERNTIQQTLPTKFNFRFTKANDNTYYVTYDVYSVVVSKQNGLRTERHHLKSAREFMQVDRVNNEWRISRFLIEYDKDSED